MSDEKPIQAEGGTFFGCVRAGRDVAGRDIHHTSGLKAEQIQELLRPLTDVAVRKGGAEGTEAQKLVVALKTEAAKDKPDDSRLAKIVDGLVTKIPEGVSALLSAFAHPLLGALAGPVTKFVLKKLQA